MKGIHVKMRITEFAPSNHFMIKLAHRLHHAFEEVIIAFSREKNLTGE